MHNQSFLPLICPVRQKWDENKLELTLKNLYWQKHKWARAQPHFRRLLTPMQICKILAPIQKISSRAQSGRRKPE